MMNGRKKVSPLADMSLFNIADRKKTMKKKTNPLKPGVLNTDLRFNVARKTSMIVISEIILI
jgi:hypothetical protein